MKREYNKPVVLSEEKLALNESIADCQYFAASGWWSFINYGGAMAADEYTRTNFFTELEVAQDVASDYITTDEQACARVCGVYLVQVGDDFYYFEDWYPHMHPTAAAWETAPGRVIPESYYSDLNKVDNWQDVNGGSIGDLPVLPGDGYETTVFKS